MNNTQHVNFRIRHSTLRPAKTRSTNSLLNFSRARLKGKGIVYSLRLKIRPEAFRDLYFTHVFYILWRRSICRNQQNTIFMYFCHVGKQTNKNLKEIPMTTNCQSVRTKHESSRGWPALSTVAHTDVTEQSQEDGVLHVWRPPQTPAHDTFLQHREQSRAYETLLPPTGTNTGPSPLSLSTAKREMLL